MRLALPLALALAACTAPPESAGVTYRALAASPQQPTDLQVHFIDVGSGDCIWIQTGDDGIEGNGRLDGQNVIIDAGDCGQFGRCNGYEHASAYLTENDRLPVGSTIDWLILTHAHSDHAGGLDEFLRDYEVLNILDPGHDRTNADGVPDRVNPNTVYGSFFQAASTEVAAGHLANFVWGVPPGFTLNWGSELDVRMLHSSTTEIAGDLNNTSIVLRLGYSDPQQTASFLFTGDAEEAVEEALIQAHGDGVRCTVLKAGHHGSNSSTTEDFLRAVRPTHVVISSGNQRFGSVMLPREETFQRIATVSGELNLNTQVWRTDRGDKTPTVIPVGEEAGDDTVMARTNGSTVAIGYASNGTVATGLDPALCQAIAASTGVQCRRPRPAGGQFCWQHD